MDESKAKGIADFVFKDVFGRENRFSLDEIRDRFAFDIELPRKVKDDMSGDPTWMSGNRAAKVMSTDIIVQQSKKDVWMKPKKKIRTITDLFSDWDEIAYFASEKMLDSSDTAECDDIYRSTSVYHSAKIHDSQKVVFSENLRNCKLVVAGHYSDTTTSSLRFSNCEHMSASFSCVWSGHASRCMYLNNCIDMYECLFCSNLRSKKYCIANMQFTKEEYMPIKQQVINWTIENFRKGNTMGF